MERAKEDRCKRINERPKLTQNAQKFDHRQFRTLQTVWKTLQHALVIGPGRPRAVPGAILGRPEHAKRVREPAKRVSEPSPKRSRTVLEQCPSEFGAASCVGHVSGAICCRFCVVARKPRYAFHVSFYSVLLGSSNKGSERVHAAENVGIRGISVSQSESGSVWATQNRARAAQFERQNAKKTHEVKRFFLWGDERLQLKRGSALRRC